MKTKKSKIIFSIFAFFILFSVFLNASLPHSILLFEGEEKGFSPGAIIELLNTDNELSVQKTNGIYKLKAEKTGSYDLDCKLLGIIPCKTVSVNVIKQKKLVPCGNAVGIKLYSKGLICLGFSEIENKSSPAKEAGIREGDIILELNGKTALDNESFAKEIENSEGNVEIKAQREGKVMHFTIAPILTYDNVRKIGMWIRDSVAGVGTLTFYDPQDKTYGALGHAVSDVDTGSIYSVASGELIGCEVLSVEKGVKGKPGELQGIFKEEVVLGKLVGNTQNGIFAKTDLKVKFPQKAVPVALKDEIKTGKATILSNISGKEIEEFEIEIQYIFNHQEDSSKDMLIKVCDKDLLQRTGGIVQGMSGSPIVQNGKLVGAVTHVFVNDPTRGYGIFIENMLAEAEKIK